MADTIPGGVYLSADGETWHDANGKVIDAPAVAAKKSTGKEKDKATGKEKDSSEPNSETKA